MDVLYEDPAEPLGELFKNTVARANDDVKRFLHTPLAAEVDVVWTNLASNPVEHYQIPQALIANIHVDRYVPRDVIGPAQRAVLKNLSLARDIARGRSVRVPTYVGLSRVKLLEDVDNIALNDGIFLRKNI